MRWLRGLGTLVAGVLAVAMIVAAGCSIDTAGTGSATPDAGGGNGGTAAMGGSGANGGASGGSGGSTCFPGPGEKVCDGVCVSTSDPAYGCSAAACIPCSVPNAAASCGPEGCSIGDCNTGFQDCNGVVLDGCETNTASDPAHCGSCTNDCYARGGVKEWACVGGTCEVTDCDLGTMDCDGDSGNGCEVTLATDVNNCGFCGNACSLEHAEAECVGGKCAIASCQGAWRDCDGVAGNGCEVHIGSDPDNCGQCGTKCPAGNGVPICTARVCDIQCPSGTANCDGNLQNGCETDTTTSLSHCGGCNTPCTRPNANTQCTGSVCRITSCKGSFRNCDGLPGNGCEVNTDTSLANCGACGSRCNLAHASESCTGGNCTLGACDPLWGNCDGNPNNGCEHDTSADNRNCGVCARACGNGETCESGACMGGSCKPPDCKNCGSCVDDCVCKVGDLSACLISCEDAGAG